LIGEDRRRHLPAFIENTFNAFLKPFAVGLLSSHQKSDRSFQRLSIWILCFKQRKCGLLSISYDLLT
jgi:hypothetical protein